MAIEDFYEDISLYRNTESRTDGGGVDNSRTLVGIIRGKIGSQTEKEFIRADKSTVEGTPTMWSEFETPPLENDQVEFSGVTYRILTVVNPFFYDRYWVSTLEVFT